MDFEVRALPQTENCFVMSTCHDAFRSQQLTRQIKTGQLVEARTGYKYDECRLLHASEAAILAVAEASLNAPYSEVIELE